MNGRRTVRSWYAILLEEKVVRVGRSRRRVSLFHVSSTARGANPMVSYLDCDFVVGNHRVFIRAITQKAKAWMHGTFEDAPHSCIMDWPLEFRDEIETKLKEAGLTYG